MTEEELRLRAARRALELTSNSVPVHALPAMPNVDDDLMDNEEHNAAAAHFNVSVGAQEPSSAAKPLVNRGPWWRHGRRQSAMGFFPIEPTIDVTGDADDANEEESLHLNFDAEHDFLSELADN
jgi:hypothetical protein